jgi:DNA-binding XRE family transcriptional regulator
MNTLKRHRKARDMKQWALAEITGISQTRISQIEKNNYIPSRAHVRKLAAYFGVKIEAMFPDGCQTSPPLGRFVKGESWQGRDWAAEPYVPPAAPPPPLVTKCWKCRAERINYEEFCYQCGAEYQHHDGMEARA